MTLHKDHTREDLYRDIQILESDLNDLSKWDAYNNDPLNQEVGNIRKALEDLKRKTIYLDLVNDDEAEMASVVGYPGQEEA